MQQQGNQHKYCEERAKGNFYDLAKLDTNELPYSKHLQLLLC